MKRKIYIIITLLLTLNMLTGCALVDVVVARIAPEVTEANDLPHLMVQRIDVTMNPRDPEFERHYLGQENLTATLNLLRDMVTSDLPEEEPRLSGGQTYYAITATYASGEQQKYYVLGYQYLKVGDDPWCEISFENAMTLSQYIRDHQSDDGSYVPPPTEPPAETTVPTETGTAPSETPV